MASAGADPAIVGLVLSGSQAREGMATAHSDHDVYVIVQDGAETGLSGMRTPYLDLVLFTLTEFRTDRTEWNRYSYAHSKVLIDRLDGEIAAIVRRQATLTPEEARQRVAEALDDYVNLVYRSMKTRGEGSHLDAAESVGPLLTTVFALHGRLRPYNKYLRWELERHPLGPPEWAVEPLLPQVQRVLADGDKPTQAGLSTQVERAARAAGHGDTLDAWGQDLELCRG